MRSFEYSYPHMNAWLGDQSVGGGGGEGMVGGWGGGGGGGGGWVGGWGGGGDSNLDPLVAGRLGRVVKSPL